MHSANNHWPRALPLALGNGNSTRTSTPSTPPPFGISTPKPTHPFSTHSDLATPLSGYHSHGTDYSSDADKAEQQPVLPRSIHTHHPLITQRDHFLVTICESLSVGLGLGSAVGIWACISETLKMTTHNVHLANWVGGITMGFFLAPLLETTMKVVFAKAGTVMKKEPECEHAGERIIEHLVATTAALLGLGTCKGVQMQYAPLHSHLGFEYAVFVVGFTAYAFIRVVLYTIATGHEYQGEKLECAWGRVPSVVIWEVLDHYHHVYLLLTVCGRDCLTFALYPYLMVMWIGWWKALDPQGRYAWVPQMLNIGFFFTFFSVLKETTYLLARPFCSRDVPMHRHHGL